MTDKASLIKSKVNVKISPEAEKILKQLSEKYEFDSDQIIDYMLKDAEIKNRTYFLLGEVREQDFKLINDAMSLMEQDNFLKYYGLKIRLWFEKQILNLNKDLIIFCLMVWSLMTIPILYFCITSW